MEYRYDEEQPTGRCGAVITGHNRSLCTDLAAANCYKLDHLKSPEIWNLVEQAKVYYVGGYHLTACVPAVLALGEEAAAKEKVNISTKSGIWKSLLISHCLDLYYEPFCTFHSTILQGSA